MDIPINAKVSCTDGPCGQEKLLIIKPGTEEITHLVINNESMPETDYMVPIDHVAGSTADQINLTCSLDELSKMPVFDKVEFIPAVLPTYNGYPFMMYPYYAAMTPDIPLEKDHLPGDELVIRRGARVEARDGHIGRVDEFLVNPANDRITHLVLQEGHLWGRKDVSIPVGQIERYEGNTIYLKLDKKEIESLPTIPLHKGRLKADQSELKGRK